MKKIILCLSLGIIIYFIPANLSAQTETDEKAYINFEDGVGFISPDSVFGMNIRFRMQNRAGFLYLDDKDDYELEATVKRCRLRFDGFIKNPRLTYYIQLSFARGDMAIDEYYVHNIVRDAMIYYRFNNKFYIGFGQGKLPGNRQRVVSSGSQQFAERSIVNSKFTIDRDFGLMAYYSGKAGFMDYNIKTAISTGDGRNVVKTDENLAYTGRLELLPLGKFTNKGDFFEGDLERESKPKISLAATYSKNFMAQKTDGQRGIYVTDKRDIETFFADVLVKYRGWSFSAEYANKMVKNPFTTSQYNGESEFYFTGHGINTQLAYLTIKDFEIAGRASYILPDKILYNDAPEQFNYVLGFTKYIDKHKTKLQLNLHYFYDKNKISGNQSDKLGAMIQLEIGI